METHFTTMCSPISKANGYLVAPVLVNRIQDLCIQMDHLWEGLHQRLIFLRRRCVWWRVPHRSQSDLTHFKVEYDANSDVFTGAVSQSCQFAVSLWICFRPLRLTRHFSHSTITILIKPITRKFITPALRNSISTRVACFSKPCLPLRKPTSKATSWVVVVFLFMASNTSPELVMPYVVSYTPYPPD